MGLVLKNPKMYVRMERRERCVCVCLCVLSGKNSSDWTDQVFYDLTVSEEKQEDPILA